MGTDRRKRRAAGWLLCLTLLGVAFGARAHDLRGTVVLLDLGAQNVAAEIQLSIPELQAALGLTVQRGFLEVDDVQLPGLPSLAFYVQQHIAASSEGRPFALQVDDVRVTQLDDAPCVVARVRWRAPDGAAARSFSLHSDLIAHEVKSHNSYVFLRRDVLAGFVDEKPKLLGLLNIDAQTLTVTAEHGGLAQGFRALFALGMRHIAEGTDHLLFLLVLLLPACFSARAGRWAEPRSLRGSLQRILLIVSAFTFGHSLTLLLGALQLASVPARFVESLIAASILVSAVHAVRPIFRVHEAWLAGGFGLVHGLAFASVLSGLSVDLPTFTASLLGFNLGIEAMQLLVVLAVVPGLVVVSRGPLYGVLRVSGALVAGVAASGWLLDRTFGIAGKLSDAADGLWGRWPWALGVLAAFVLATLVRGRAGSRSPR